LDYGGGERVALALDIKIQKSTNNTKSLNDLFARLYEQFGKTNTLYELNDIITITNQLTGENLQSFFDDYVTGTKRIPVTEYLAVMGLQLDGYLDDVYISSFEKPTDEQLQIKKGILGL